MKPLSESETQELSLALITELKSTILEFYYKHPEAQECGEALQISAFVPLLSEAIAVQLLLMTDFMATDKEISIFMKGHTDLIDDATREFIGFWEQFSDTLASHEKVDS